MRLSDYFSIAVNAGFGAITGWLIAGSVGSIIGLVLGLVFSVFAARSNVRPGIAMTVFVGAMAGGLIGSSVVSTICLPDSCTGLEISAGVVTAIASFVGVGIVAALVTRSFDEYNEREDAGLPPTSVGCEVPQETPDDRPQTSDDR